MKKKNSELFKSVKKPKVNKYKNLQNKLFGNNSNNYEEKYNDPFDYNKEYENNLISQIENLFTPIKNDNNIEIGSLKNILKNDYNDYMDPFSLNKEKVLLLFKFLKINSKYQKVIYGIKKVFYSYRNLIIKFLLYIIKTEYNNLNGKSI
jgi:hypothetical protein